MPFNSRYFPSLEQQEAYIRCLSRIKIGDILDVREGNKWKERVKVVWIDHCNTYPFYAGLVIPSIIVGPITFNGFRVISRGLGTAQPLDIVFHNYCKHLGIAIDSMDGAYYKSSLAWIRASLVITKIKKS